MTNKLSNSPAFLSRKAIIQAELLKRAKARQTITYGELAQIVGFGNQGLGKILTDVGSEEATAGRPDIGCLAVKADTGFPSYVGTDKASRSSAIALRQRVFAYHAEPTPDPV